MILRLKDNNFDRLTYCLTQFDLKLEITLENLPIPGSFWGDEEAGLIKNRIYATPETPIHSILHESCHYICMDSSRRETLHTNAEGDYDEENAVCYLQIILANEIELMGQKKMFSDMDEWGYSFRLGSAQKWFEEDAQDAKEWLVSHSLINNKNQCLYNLRKL